MDSRMEKNATLAVLMALVASQGCLFRPQPVATPAMDNSSVAGRVGFEFVPDPNSPRPALSAGQRFSRPIPLVTRLPEYPQEALLSELAPVMLVARIIVEEDGTVQEIQASPLEKSTDSGSREPFWAAIRQAVLRWEFAPAIILTLKERQDLEGGGEDKEELTDARPVRTYLDLRFKFEVVDGQGRVQLDSNP